MKINNFFSLAVVVLLTSLLFSCHHNDDEYDPTPYDVTIPYGFPTQLNIPSDNPMTVEGIALGKLLFEDPHLCGYTGTVADSLMSCSSCHVRAHNYDVGMDNARFPNGVTHGRTGIATPHNAMPLMNLVFNNQGYFWNGMICADNPNANRRTLEDVVAMGITAPHEMSSTTARAVAAIQKDSRYPALFKNAFGSEEITLDRIEKAIAQYLRSLVSGNSKFDRYLQGKEQLTPQELHGYILFTTESGADCFHCHGSEGSPLFTTNLFYNNGLDNTFTDTRDRYAFTGNEQDRGCYRAPSLRNIEVSAPYMHDGRFKTLDAVLQFYNEGLVYSPYISPLMHKINDGGAHLTPSELADLKAFLLTLTDDEFLGYEK